LSAVAACPILRAMSNGFGDPSLLEPASRGEVENGERPSLRDILESFERKLIATVLLAAGGNQRRAAEALGVLPTTFQEKLKRFGLTHQRPVRRARRGERAAVSDGTERPRDEAVQTPRENHRK
jgi:hypothetical protein